MRIISVRSSSIVYSAILALMISSPLLGQSVALNENCVISVLNRTIPVSSDGGWTLPNVPSFMGQIRARANCVVDGVTVSGESEFFSVIQDGITQVGEISFENTTPVPSGLLFVNQEQVVLSSNAAVQLDVIAEYSDGSQSDVLISGSGVNFNSSNPAIATVNSDGLVTPLTSGNVLITARLEGALAIKPVFISLSGDVDGDGLPDDFELLNGLDPNDAIDAMEDQDSDGLSALEEFGIGTDINQADSDNDGLEDGEEVVLGEDGFITDPLLSDTDGDQISDGLELIAGSDPTDSSSFDLSSVLDSIDIEQGNFELVFNGIQTEVSAQLLVSGYLLDGSRLDLTAHPDTQYSSSSLATVSFGLVRGEVFGGENGIGTVTAASGGFSDSVVITVSSFEGQSLARLNMPIGNSRNIAVQGTYVYIAQSAGLYIVDVLDPEAPYVVNLVATGDASWDVKVRGNRAFVADGAAGIKVVDITDPPLAQVVGSYAAPGDYRRLAVSDGLLVAADVSDDTYDLILLDITEPDDPLFVSEVQDFGEIFGMDLSVEESLLVVSSLGGSERLKVIDITDKFAPVLRFAVHGGQDVAIDGRYLYSGITTGLDATGLQPAEPGYLTYLVDENYIAQEIQSSGIGFWGREVELISDYAFFIDELFIFGGDSQVIALVNRKDLENPFYQTIFTIGGAQSEPTALQEFSVDSRYFYILDGALEIYQYIDIKDDAGVAPEVSIVELPESTVFAEGETYTFKVDADDDIAVQSIDLLIDGVVIGTDTTFPFEITATIPREIGQFEVVAAAVDFSNNVGFSDAVVIDIRGDIDQDRLLDELEPGIGTDLNDSDTDDDGLSDGRELDLSTDPLNPDTDGDGTPDGQEVRAGTNPRSSTEDWIDETISLTDDVSLAQLNVQGATVVSSYNISVSGNVSISGNASSIQAESLNIDGELVIDEAELVLEVNSFSAGVIRLVNGATLTVPDSISSGYTPLLISSEEIFIDASSSIDVSGKGFVAGRSGPNNLSSGTSLETRFGCHGGDVSYFDQTEITDCDYGRYARASFAGSGSGSAGGGFIEIASDRLVVDGLIAANGGAEGSGSYGAGGGIHVVTNSIEGIGQIEALGAEHSSNRSSSGGRVSVIVPDTTLWFGTISAASDLGSSGNRVAGAGTVYLQSPSAEFGSLTIDNGVAGVADTDNLGATVVEHVGRRLIRDITDLGNGSWEIDTYNGPVFITESGSITQSGAGSVAYHYFSFDEREEISLSVYAEGFGPSVVLFTDDGALDEDDFILRFTETGFGSEVNEIFTIEPGDYVLAVADHYLYTDDAVLGQKTNRAGGTYDIQIETSSDWDPTQVEYQFGLQGLVVDLDASETLGQHYLIESNTESQLVIVTDDDLSGYVGSELIGVHRFETLVVRDGAYADFGGDRVEIADWGNSEISNGVLRNVDMPLAQMEYFYQSNVDGVIGFENFEFPNLTITGTGTISFEELELTGELSVSNGVLVVSTLSAGGVNIADGATLVVSEISLSGDMMVENGSRLTVPEPTSDGYTPLQIDVLGDVTIDLSSSIDLDGKGFYTGNYGPLEDSGTETLACHGADASSTVSSEDLDCAYGRYVRAKFPGSSGSQSGDNMGEGGGYLRLDANRLVLDGTISANGMPGSYSGAGGGIDIETKVIEGVGMISANGASTSTRSSSGGRISVRFDDNSLWTGNLLALGPNHSSNSSRSAGAGTIFVKDNAESYGSLTIANGISGLSDSSDLGMTKIESVGQRTIRSVSDLGDNNWLIDTIAGSVDYYNSGSIASQGNGSIAFEYFSVDQDQSVTISLNPEVFEANFRVYIDDGSLDAGDYVANESSPIEGQQISETLQLESGNYVVAVANAYIDDSDVVAGETTNSFFGNYEIWIETASDWKVSDLESEYGLQGLYVDLDASSEAGPIYEVFSNTERQLIIQTSDNLAVYQGQELIGVHRFERFNALNGALVDFGGDRLEISDLFGSDISDAVIRNVTLPETDLQYFAQNNVDGKFELGNYEVGDLNISTEGFSFDNLTLSGNLTIDGGSLTAPNIVVSSLTLSAAGLLETSSVSASGSVEMLEGSFITVSQPTSDGYTSLMMDVVGSISIDPTSSINLSGSGFDANRSWPIGSTDAAYESCHGGNRANSVNEDVQDCAYGRYVKAEFAGSGGIASGSNTGEGGGYASIKADQLILDGSILADGAVGFYSGAGGGIDIEASNLIGSGFISAVGADSTSTGRNSAGGRISVRLQDDAFWFGDYYSFGSEAASASFRYGGAGTTFVRNINEPYGSLYVDNGQQGVSTQSNLGVTPIESIGRHLITDITNLGNNRWAIDRFVGALDVYDSGTVTASGAGSVAYHYFSVGIDQFTEITVEPDLFDADFILFVDDGQLDGGDYIGDAWTTQNGVPVTELFDLDIGNYVLAIADYNLSSSEAVAGSNSNNPAGDYEVWIRSVGKWAPTDIEAGQGLQGLTVDLDASELLSPVYEIESNTSSRLIISTTDDLSGYVGSDLIGVHQFERLQILNGASVDFGGDRIEVNDLGNSEVIDAVIQNQDALSNFP